MRFFTLTSSPPCEVCGETGKYVSRALGVCLQCIRERFEEAKPYIEASHERSRREFGLPPSTPKRGSAKCTLCVNECRPEKGGVGLCGVRVAKEKGMANLAGGSNAYVEWYYDPLPTNCVAAWACGADIASKQELGFVGKNLAVFYGGCSFDCLFCQNWHHRRLANSSRPKSPRELVEAVDNATYCICYFGGDPTPQLNHALKASELALERARKEGRPLRICFETNGTMHPKLLERMIDLALQSGGTIKFDLKAWSEELNFALCGVTNKRTLDNFALLAERAKERPEPPLAAASTLLIPGYVDEHEVRCLAEFIASVNPTVPYSLLAFHPEYLMVDLPPTPRSLAIRCYEAAMEAGLRRVRIGNVHLLW